MIQRGILFAGCMVMGSLYLTGTAQEGKPQDEKSAVSMSWSGYMQTDDRLNLSGARDISWQEYRFDLRSELKVEKKARFCGEFWLRDMGEKDLKYLSDLKKSSSVLPIDISFRKAFVDIFDVGIPSLDLTIGRQRFVWGTADKINPTDNLNPDDLEDIWDMGRHLGSDGIQAKYYLGKLTLSAVYLPLFRPAVLPLGAASAAILPRPSSLSEMKIQNYIDTIIVPDSRPKESSSAAIRTSVHFTGFDASLSYVYCREDIPVLSEIVLFPQAQSRSQADVDMRDGSVEIKDVKSTYVYPRMHIAGFDFAGMAGRFGFWGEAALYMPEQGIDVKTSLGGNDTVAQVFQSLRYIPLLLADQPSPFSGTPYVKFVAGVDFSLPWNMYFNLQYAHGYVHERGDGIEDYIFFNADWSFFNSKLKISPFGIILEIKDYAAFEESYALVDQPQLTWYPVENAEINMGVRLIDASPGTFFSALKNNEAFLRVKYGF
jgi:hypothetical protein